MGRPRVPVRGYKEISADSPKTCVNCYFRHGYGGEHRTAPETHVCELWREDDEE